MRHFSEFYTITYRGIMHVIYTRKIRTDRTLLIINNGEIKGVQRAKVSAQNNKPRLSEIENC